MIQSTPVMPETLPAARGRPTRSPGSRGPPIARAYSRGDQRPTARRPRPQRRERARARARFAPLAIVALAAFAVGARRRACATSRRRPPWRASGPRAWERGDYPAMHALLSDRARSRASLKRFVRTYRQAAETVTLAKVRAGTPRRADDDAYDLPVRLQTRIFGRLSGQRARCR